MITRQSDTIFSLAAPKWNEEHQPTGRFDTEKEFMDATMPHYWNSHREPDHPTSLDHPDADLALVRGWKPVDSLHPHWTKSAPGVEHSIIPSPVDLSRSGEGKWQHVMHVEREGGSRRILYKDHPTLESALDAVHNKNYEGYEDAGAV